MATSGLKLGKDFTFCYGTFIQTTFGLLNASAILAGNTQKIVCLNLSEDAMLVLSPSMACPMLVNRSYGFCTELKLVDSLQVIESTSSTPPPKLYFNP